MPTDLDRVQGAWSITALEMDGQEMSLPVIGDARVVIENDRFKSSGMGMDYEGMVTLQDKQKPEATSRGPCQSSHFQRRNGSRPGGSG